MSGIYGIISLDNQTIDSNELLLMSKPFEKYKSISHDVKQDTNYGVGIFYSGILESNIEKTPYVTNDLLVFFEGVIDNSESIIKKFNISCSEEFSNSWLICELYNLIGMDLLKECYGDYSLVILDRKSSEVYCSRDHVGKKVLYYCINDNKFYFSSLLMSFKYALKLKHNIKWLKMFVGIPNILQELDPELTVVESVLYAPIAQYLEVNLETIKKHVFWDPTKLPLKTYNNKEEIYSEFLELYTRVIQEKINYNGEIGIQLSGGLDSSSIAMIASEKLDENSKSLYSYTSVPIDDYKNWLNNRLIPDETNLVKLICDKATNIIPKFVNSDWLNSWDNIDWILDVYEQPYKFVENSVYIRDLAKNASEDGCIILLDGQFGNSYLSMGDFEEQLYELIKSFKWLKAYKETKLFTKNYGYSMKVFIKYYLKLLYHNLKITKRDYRSSLVKANSDELKWIEDELRDFGYSSKPLNGFDDFKYGALNHARLNQLASVESKVGMYYNIMKRDPTRDPRIIDFMWSIPNDIYVVDGIERAFIRNVMKDTLPDEINKVIRRRGRQSPDFLQKIEPIYDEILVKLKEFSTKEEFEYINYSEVNKLINSNKKILYTESKGNEIRNLIILAILDRYDSKERSKDEERVERT